MKQLGNTLYDLIDDNGEYVTYQKTTVSYDGTVIAPENESTYLDGVTYKKLPNGGGYAKRVLKEGRINIKAFGLKGDGTPEDVNLLIKALKFGKLFWPKTINGYLFSSNINITVSGEIDITSDGATISMPSGGSAITLNQITNGEISGLKIQGPSSLEYVTDKYYGLVLNNCSNVKINNVTTNNGGILFTASNNIECQGCKVLSAPYMGIFVNNSTNIKIHNKNYVEKACVAYRTEQSYDVEIIGNEAWDIFGDGIRIEDSQRCKILGNTLKSCNGAVMIYGPQSDFNFDTKDIEVKDNYFINCYGSYSVPPIDSYINGVTGYGVATKFYVDKMLLRDNFFINDSLPEPFIDYTNGETVIFNPANTFNVQQVSTDTTGDSPFSVDAFGKYVELTNVDNTVMPIDWLYYINLPSPVDLSSRRFVVDTYANGTGTIDVDKWSINLYSGVDKTNLLCTLPLYAHNVSRQAVPALVIIPEDIDVSVVQCIEIVSNYVSSGNIIIGKWFTQLGMRIGYLHSLNDVTRIKDIYVGKNTMVNVQREYYFKHFSAQLAIAPYFIEEGELLVSDTTQYPINNRKGRRIFDSTLNVPLWWDGNTWSNWNTGVTKGTGSSTITHVKNPSDGLYRNPSAISTGAITIELPPGINGSMVIVKGTVFSYEYKTFDFLITGYAQSDSVAWNRGNATLYTNNELLNHTVRFGKKSDNTRILYIGELDSTWEYMGVVISEVSGLGTNATRKNIKSGWKVRLETTAFESITSTITNTNITPNATTEIKGKVLQAEISSDTSTDVGETYSQTEVQAVLDELRDLKSKLRTAGIIAI